MSRRQRRTAPARSLLRVGAVLIALAMPHGCERAVPGRDEPPVLELTHDTIRLEPGVALVEIAVRRDATGEFEPASARARAGDVIRFTSHDGAGHAIAFDAAALDATIRDFLERTGQLRGPPLISAGAAWVITLENAPNGEYPFRCTTHDAHGRVIVEAPAGEGR